MLNVGQKQAQRKSKAASKSTKAEGTEFVLLNKNFGNYPIARDPRARMDWQRGKSCWKCAPEHADFWIMLPLGGKAERRCPTGFDVRVLLTLLRQSVTTRDGVLVYRSLGRLLDMLQLPDCYDNRQRLKQALLLFSEIKLVFDRWYGKDGDNEMHLPPPIKRLEERGRYELRITMHADWRHLHKDGFCVQVPVTLPISAATQNTILNMLTVKSGIVAGVRRTQRYSRRSLARKFGILHDRRKSVLMDAVKKACAWLEDIGGQAEPEIDKRGVAFVYKRLRYVKKVAPNPKAKVKSKAETTPKEPTAKMVYAYGMMIPENEEEWSKM